MSIANTLVFNNSQRLLKDLYIPLSIIDSSTRKIKTKLTGYPKSFMDKYQKVLVTDTAGMGKSTLMKILFIDIVDKNYGAPIFIELRRLSKEKTIIKEIHEQISSIDKGFNSQVLFELIKQGGFIFILDGFDEISLADREIVTSDLQTFIDKASGNKFVLTSRPEKALSSFGEFEQFSIEPLSKKEAHELLRKYDRQGEISSLLIKKLDEKEMENIDEFMINPLLVSLLYTAFQYKQAIPFKKYLFYRQVYDANFESHDLTKGDSYSHDKYSKLEIDDFHRVLRHIGFITFQKQKIEFDKDELLNLIQESKEFCVGLSFTVSDFFNDLLITVPLFAQDGNYYRWAHKSLQEYFAAQFIYLDAKEAQSLILKEIYEHREIDKFQNILDLYYDMDYRGFRDVILFTFLKEYESFYNHYLKGIDKDVISPSLISERKEILFFNDAYLFYVGISAQKLDHEKLNEMVENHLKSKSNERAKLNGILIDSKYTRGWLILYKEDPKIVVLSILFAKKNNIVKFLPHLDREKKIKLYYKFNKKYTPIILTDDPTDQFNAKENFGPVNELLKYTALRSLVIDTDNALLLLSEIESSLSKRTSNKFQISNVS